MNNPKYFLNRHDKPTLFEPTFLLFCITGLQMSANYSVGTPF